jgi:hypothetical protein
MIKHRYFIAICLMFTCGGTALAEEATNLDIGKAAVKYMRDKLTADKPYDRLQACPPLFLECFPDGWSYLKDAWNQEVPGRPMGASVTWCTLLVEPAAEKSPDELAALIADWLGKKPKIKATVKATCKPAVAQGARAESAGSPVNDAAGSGRTDLIR